MLEEPSVLVVDDEQAWLQTCKAILEKANFKVFVSSNGRSALDVLGREPVDVVISDVRMPEVDGLSLLREVKQRHARSEVIMLTAYGSVETAVQATKMGAYDFLLKPVEFEDILADLRAILREKRGKAYSPDKDLHRGDGLYGIVGRSRAMKEVFKLIKKVAASDSAVLIEGETGTGKEMVANAIHHTSARKGEPFVKMNCASVPDTLLESELFGFEQGAFTGAINRRTGKLEAAHGGSLLLDEIGDMPLAMQAKVLRVLEDGSFERLGGNETLTTDMRVIACTNQHLGTKIREGEFREDLFYRISTIGIKMPPLRERKEDILILVNHFMHKLCHRMNRSVPTLAPETWAMLKAHPWPGNVRELVHVVERLLVLTSDGAEIQPKDLPVNLLRDSSLPQPKSDSAKLSLRQVEKTHIENVLKFAEGNKNRAARLLGIHRETLYKRMKEFRL